MQSTVPEDSQWSSPRGEMERVRLSEWARGEGISRITAYRMLRRGLLPVPFERSPTGRWYVLLPRKQIGRLGIYVRTKPGEGRISEINAQTAILSEWAAHHHLNVFTVVQEVADPVTDPLPRLERLLADRALTHILVHTPTVIGPSYRLLVAALAAQGRMIIVARQEWRVGGGRDRNTV